LQALRSSYQAIWITNYGRNQSGKLKGIRAALF